MISLLVPTRDRPENIKRLYKSLQDTTADMDNIELLIYTDDDDKSYDDLGLPIRHFKGPSQVLSNCWNALVPHAKGDILMHCGDDLIFRTMAWDEKVRAEFKKYPDHIVFVYGNDGSGHDGTFGTHGFIHKRWVETVGYFVPPYFSSDYNDTWLNDVAEMIDRHNHIDILTEHMHYIFGKGPFDKTHQERVERGRRDGVTELYNKTLRKREKDANKLRRVIARAGS